MSFYARTTSLNSQILLQVKIYDRCSRTDMIVHVHEFRFVLCPSLCNLECIREDGRYTVSRLCTRCHNYDFERAWLNSSVAAPCSWCFQRSRLAQLCQFFSLPVGFFHERREKTSLSLSLSWLVTLTEDRTRIDTNDSQVHVEFDIYCVA